MKYILQVHLYTEWINHVKVHCGCNSFFLLLVIRAWSIQMILHPFSFLLIILEFQWQDILSWYLVI